MTWITASFPNLSPETRNKIVAGTTTRAGGISIAPYSGLNVASHVGDDIAAVYANRAILREQLNLPTEPYWLHQTHTATVVDIPYEYRPLMPSDASTTRCSGHVCAVMTADCLPLLVVNSQGDEVAAIHAGWRGLADGIIGETLKALRSKPEELHVYLGPAIGPTAFEVGEDVIEEFRRAGHNVLACFKPTSKPGKFLADLYEIAKIQLQYANVTHISGGEFCTYSDPERFYSYRRDGKTGRMVSLIWIV